MGAYIGTVQLDFPLRWVNKGSLVALGSDTSTRNGNVVMLRGTPIEDAPNAAELKFEYETITTVNQLRTLALTGETYSADLEDDGTVRHVIIAHGGIKSVEHCAYGEDVVQADVEDSPMDLYKGKIALWIVG